jgi:hypothetical protein
VAVIKVTNYEWVAGFGTGGFKYVQQSVSPFTRKNTWELKMDRKFLDEMIGELEARYNVDGQLDARAVIDLLAVIVQNLKFEHGE